MTHQPGVYVPLRALFLVSCVGVIIEALLDNKHQAITQISRASVHLGV